MGLSLCPINERTSVCDTCICSITRGLVQGPELRYDPLPFPPPHPKSISRYQRFKRARALGEATPSFFFYTTRVFVFISTDLRTSDTLKVSTAINRRKKKSVIVVVRCHKSDLSQDTKPALKQRVSCHIGVLWF